MKKLDKSISHLETSKTILTENKSRINDAHANLRAMNQILKDQSDTIRRESQSIEASIAKNEGRAVTSENIDEIIYPANDGFSKKILELKADSVAIEESIDMVR